MFPIRPSLNYSIFPILCCMAFFSEFFTCIQQGISVTPPKANLWHPCHGQAYHLQTASRGTTGVVMAVSQTIPSGHLVPLPLYLCLPPIMGSVSDDHSFPTNMWMHKETSNTHKQAVWVVIVLSPLYVDTYGDV